MILLILIVNWELIVVNKLRFILFVFLLIYITNPYLK
jgi:hypothetical protein